MHTEIIRFTSPRLTLFQSPNFLFSLTLIRHSIYVAFFRTNCDINRGIHMIFFKFLVKNIILLLFSMSNIKSDLQRKSRNYCSNYANKLKIQVEIPCLFGFLTFPIKFICRRMSIVFSIKYYSYAPILVHSWFIYLMAKVANTELFLIDFCYWITALKKALNFDFY